MSAAEPLAQGDGLRVVVRTAQPRDAQLVCALIEPLGVSATICETPEAVLHHARRDMGTLIIGEEAMTAPFVDALDDVLRDSPTWSSVPVLMCTPQADGESGRQDAAHRARALAARLGPACDVVALQRPLAPQTLASAVRLALRDRQRQYEVRDLLARLHTSAQALEGEVQERTQQLRDEARARERLTREVLTVATREQRRIAQDIHDGLGSHLTGIALLSHGLAEDLRDGRPVDPAMLDRVGDLADDGIDKARALARGINPAPLEAGGLGGGLAKMAEDVARDMGVPCRFRQETPLPALGDEVESHLYRIAQEATHNAVKHAGARLITIALGCPHAEAVRLTVEDDGRGIPKPLPTKGMGLGTMRYRAGIIGGRLSIVRASGGGTRVACEIPFSVLPTP